MSHKCCLDKKTNLFLIKFVEPGRTFLLIFWDVLKWNPPANGKQEKLKTLASMNSTCIILTDYLTGVSLHFHLFLTCATPTALQQANMEDFEEICDGPQLITKTNLATRFTLPVRAFQNGQTATLSCEKHFQALPDWLAAGWNGVKDDIARGAPLLCWSWHRQ